VGEQWPQLPGQIESTQIALHGFRLVIFRRPQGSVFRPKPGKHILGKEVTMRGPVSGTMGVSRTCMEKLHATRNFHEVAVR
jgi:hypothetical protein